jgi:hypothetical protein
MAIPILTLETLADHVADYRRRIEQRRAAIASRPHEKRFSLSTPPQDSKDFMDALSDAARTVSDRVFSSSDDATRFRPHMFDLTAAQEALGHACQRERSRLGRAFIEAARDGDGNLVRAFIEEAFPIDYADPRTRETALHAAAGSRARRSVRVLAQHWPDFLIRDRQGRLASELAYLYGEDPAMAHMLGIKERKDANATGRKAARRLFRFPAP